MCRALIIFSVLVAVSTVGLADVRLPAFFSSDMVLQRNTDLRVWGWADPGEVVRISLKEKTYESKTDKNGRWAIDVGKHEAGGPFEIKITGKNEVVLENILFGDVWFCSGQSNMDWGMNVDYYGERAIAEANYPNIRLFKVEKRQSQSPQADVEGEWQECSPATVGRFSAVAYYFGKEIYKSQGIPVGLIQSSWGGSGIVSWTSADGFNQLPQFEKDIELLQSKQDYLKIKSEKYQEKLDSWFSGIGSNSPILLSADRLDPAAMQRVRWTPTKMPVVWERTAVGDLDGMVWYRTFFNEGELLKNDQKSFLSLGKLDDHDIVFLNNQRIGHAGWKEWDRSYEIPDSLLKAEGNELVVGIIDYGGAGGFAGTPNDLFIDSFDKAEANKRYPLPETWEYFVDDYAPKVKPVWLGGIVEPTILYNAMVSPITRFPVKGALWYQGEHSKSKPEGYDRLLKALITDWRNQWNQPDLPFFFVQLPNYANEPGQYPAGNWAVLRSNQAKALELHNTGMAVTYDVGNPYDIHPLHKEPVGHRLAMSARHIAYGEDVVPSGPVLKMATQVENVIRLTFETYGEKLIARDPYGYLKGFQVVNKKDNVIPVQARIAGDDIIIDLKDIGPAEKIRYAWEDNPDANLYNESGLPAPPFEYRFEGQTDQH